METFATIVKYIFVISVAVEVALILRALVALAREKARTVEATAQPGEE